MKFLYNKKRNEENTEDEELQFELLQQSPQDFSVNEKIGMALLNCNVHFLTGFIEEHNVEQTIKWIVYENLIPPDPENPKILTLYINSPGGSLNDALALVDTIQSSRHPIRTVGIGQIVSAAFLIFSAGKRGERYISKNTSIMCHQFSAELYGKHHDIKAHIKEFELSNQRMMKVLQDTTGLDNRTIKNKLLPPTDVWLTPEELVNYQVADQII